MAYGDLPIGAEHKPNKGLEGGACNRERCQAEPALWFNHGMHKWYCGDCARAIGDDHVNRMDWNLRWKPECGHDQFETREQIDARKAAEPPAPPPPAPKYDLGDFPLHTRRYRPRHIKSSSLERLLAKAKR